MPQLFKRRYALLGLFATLLYINTIGHGYTLDDAIVIYDNEFTTQGVKGIPGLLKYDTFRGFFKVEGKSDLVSGGRYRPLTPIMFALEWQAFGKQPWIGHAINIVLFSVLCILLLLILETFFKTTKHALWWPMVVCVLFAAHPIHTEVVANIKGRDEIMSMILGSLAIYMALKSKPTSINQLLAGLCIFLGLMAKEMAITFIPIAFLVAYLIKEQSIIRSIRSCLPLIVGTTVYLIIRFSILGFNLGGSEVSEMMNNPFIKYDNGMYVAFDAVEKAASIALGLGKYLLLLLFPLQLTHDYYPRQLGIPTLTDPFVLLSILAYIGLIFIALHGLKKKNRLSFFILYYLLSLLLISNLFFPIGTHMGERFVFMASFGFIGAIVLGINENLKSISWTKWIFIGVTLLFSMKTIHRNMAWKNDYTLFNTDVKVSGNSAKCLNAAGGSIVSKCLGSEMKDCDLNEVEKGLSYLNRALEIHPRYKFAHLIKGNAHFILKQYPLAIQSFTNALNIDPTLSDAKTNIMLAYIEEAKDLGQNKGQPDKAINMLKQAQRIDDNNLEVLRLLGVAHGVKQEMQTAMEYFNRMLEIDPKNADAYMNLGITLINSGQKEEGERHIQKAKELNPNINQ